MRHFKGTMSSQKCIKTQPWHSRQQPIVLPKIGMLNVYMSSARGTSCKATPRCCPTVCSLSCQWCEAFDLSLAGTACWRPGAPCQNFCHSVDTRWHSALNICYSLYRCCRGILLACRITAIQESLEIDEEGVMNRCAVLHPACELSAAHLHNFLFGWIGPRGQGEVWPTLMLVCHM